MAHRVFRSLDFYKYCLSAFLILINGFPIKGVPEVPSDAPKSPTVKECRAHIEAALEQYWDASEEGNEGGDATLDNRPTSGRSGESLGAKTETQSDDETNQDDDIDPPVDVQTKDDMQEGEDEKGDDDEDEEEETDENELGTEDEEDEVAETEGSLEEKEKHVEVEDDDEDEEEEDEDEDEEDDEEEASELSEEEEDEDEDEDDEDEEEEEDENEGITGTEAESGESRETDTGDKAKRVSGEQDSEEEEEEEEEGGGEDQEEEEEEEEEEEGSEKDEEEEEEEEDESAEEEAQKQEEKVSDEEEEEEEEEEKDRDEKDEEEEEKDRDEEDEEEGEEEEEEGAGIEPEAVQKDAERGDKVTGDTHSAPVGMAPELPATEPTSDQPQASPVEEKAALETPTEEDEEQEEAEAEEEEAEEEEEEKEAEEEEKEEETEEEEEEEEETEEEQEEKETEEEEEEEEETKKELEEEEEEEDLIENIYEEEEEDITVKPGEKLRSRDHVDAILGLDDIGTEYDMAEEKLAQSIFHEIKKIHTTSIKPMEMLYKYADSTTRLLGDAEIFSKPMVLFLGPWSAGKTTIINYLLGLERTPEALKTGTGITDLDFTVLTYGEQRRVTSGTALAAEWRYAGLQKFGQGLLDHFKGITIPHTLLKKITLVDTPGIIESKKNSERGYPFNDAFQWFIDRADAIYVVLDPTKVDIGAELGSVIDQLKGREPRFILNKADTIRRSDLMRVVGQLFWNLSPLMSSTEAPVIYAVSLTTKPFHPSAPSKFLNDQENNFLYDLKDTIDKHVENRILYARRHAVRVRNHCKMVDCYLSTYYKHKSIFSSKKNVAKLITENPMDYNIYDGLSSMTNVSRYDLPNPLAYKHFFRMHPLYDFKPLVSTCSYFRGCPMDKLDLAISNDLPELMAKYKKAKLDIPAPVMPEGR